VLNTLSHARKSGQTPSERDFMTHIEPIAVSIQEAVRLSGVGRSSIYEAVNRGEIPIRKRGRRSLVMVEDLRRWIETLPSTNSTAANAA
jgi:excisionase family DNA binding protein